jgi:hypothetical protein
MHKIIKTRLSIAAARRSSMMKSILNESDISEENRKLETDIQEIRNTIYSTRTINDSTDSNITNSPRSVKKKLSEIHFKFKGGSALNVTNYKNINFEKIETLSEGRNSIFRPNRESYSKNFKADLKTLDIISNLDTAGTTKYTYTKNSRDEKATIESKIKFDRTPKKFPSKVSKSSITSTIYSPRDNAFKSNFRLTKKMSQFRLHTEESFFPKINETTTHFDLETRENTEGTHKDTWKNQNSFLEHFMESFDLDKISIADLKGITTQYCKKFLSLNNLQIDEIIQK